MTATAWITATSGLIGALIGAGAALIGQTLEARRRARSSQHGELKTAIEELLTCAGAVDLRIHDSLVLATNAGSVVGLFERIVGHSIPLDLAQTLERINEVATAMQRAAARIWLMGDPETVALANAVVGRAMEVVNAHHTPAAGRVRNSLRIAITGRHVSDTERLDDARRELAQARKALGDHTRRLLDLPCTNLFAVAAIE